MADANGLAEYINACLADDLQRELEDQMVNGAGAGEDFTGILNAGILTEGAGAGPFYAIRAGITQVATTGRTSPTAIVANPTNVQEWDLAEVSAETNRFLGDPFGRTGPRTLWGLPVISADVIAEGTCIVGDFRKAILWTARRCRSRWGLSMTTSRGTSCGSSVSSGPGSAWSVHPRSWTWSV